MNKYFLIAALALLFSCQHKKLAKSSKPTETTTAPSTNVEPKEIIKDVVIDANADMSDKGAMFSVDSMTVSGNILSVFVTYSGGCKEHSWDLTSNGKFAKSLPPQVSVNLKHTNNGDACRELISKEIKFNVAKLKYPGGKKVIIRLGDKQVAYSIE